MTPRARVVRAAEAGGAKALFEGGLGGAGGRAVARRIAGAEADGRLAAERIVDQARARADALVAGALERSASTIAAEVTAKWLALRQAEARWLERDADRLVPMATLLAERLLNAALELDPARVVALARGVLDEARGARRARIDAHPADAAELSDALTTGGLDPQSVEVRADAALARGELRLHTDLGTIDARLAPRFERLAVALRHVLASAASAPGGRTGE